MDEFTDSGRAARVGSELLNSLKERVATDGQGRRTCSMLFLVLSLTIVLPPVVIDFLMGGKALKMMASILSGREYGIALELLGPVLVTFFLPAIIAIVLGVALLLGTHDRRRCGKLLLLYAGFLVFMLAWPLLPIPWTAMGIDNAYASRLESFSWTAIMGLTFMEGWAVFLHVPVIVLLWCSSLFVGWCATSQH